MLNVVNSYGMDSKAREIAARAQAKAQTAIDAVGALGQTSAVRAFVPTAASRLAWDAGLGTFVGTEDAETPAVVAPPVEVALQQETNYTETGTTYVFGILARTGHATLWNGGTELFDGTVDLLNGESVYVAVLFDASMATTGTGEINVRVEDGTSAPNQYFFDSADSSVLLYKDANYFTHFVSPSTADGYTRAVALGGDKGIAYMKLEANQDLTARGLRILGSGLFPSADNIAATQLLAISYSPIDHTADVFTPADPPTQQIATLDATAAYQALSLDDVTATLALPSLPASDTIVEHVLELTTANGGTLVVPSSMIHRRYGEAPPYTTSRDFAVLRRADGTVVLSAPAVGS